VGSEREERERRRMLAIGTAEGTVLLVEAASGEERQALVGHVGKVCSVSMSADGRAVASAGDDRSWNIWDVASGEHRVCSRVHDGRGGCTCLVRPGKPTRFDSWCPEWLHAPGVTTVTFSPCCKNGLKIATGGRAVTVWDVQTGVAESRMRWPAHVPAWSALQGQTQSPFWSDVHSLSFTSDGLLLAGGKCGDAAIYIWNVLTGNTP
jgi:WD40 repeat protein